MLCVGMRRVKMLCRSKVSRSYEREMMLDLVIAICGMW